ncbi:hypothetical protein [Burkholderia multivorans]|uniref:Nmad3 family putative nucleotide modification protein n=1 Tax=Burkholderia multivorans TaxID=87883 RepID=UPI001C26922E|nr:hypothetical protein [Burkholderia multivorans]MBU9552889.1 hypothetical protein [Burkholderia multivorans]
MPETKILFLRVGIDRGCGGRLSPVEADGRFEYVPIPEGAPVHNAMRYADIPSRRGGTLAQVIGMDAPAHYDPEFVTYSYGEPGHPKRSQLLTLSPGDYLVFYAGFQGHGIATGTCCVIGYFVVSSVHAMNPELPWPPDIASRLNNAHFRRVQREDKLVVVEGDKERSRLLERAVPISDGVQQIVPSVANTVGFSGSVKRAIGRWVPATHVGVTASWLQAMA